jgi:O-antigen/teichoic acid export membrane protein
MRPMLHSMRALASGTSRVVVASAAGQAGTLVASLLVANLVGVAGFGLYAFVASGVNAALVLVQGSFGLMATRYVAEYRDRDPGRAGEVIDSGAAWTLAAGLLAAAVLVAVSWSQHRHGGAHDLFGVALVALAVAVPLAAVAQFYLSALTGLQGWAVLVQVALVGAAASVVLPVLGAMSRGAAGACLGLAAAALVRMLYGAWRTRSAARAMGVSFPPGQVRLPAEMLRRFALPAFLTASLFAAALWFGNVYLLAQPDGATHLGLYAAAYTLRTLVVFLPAQLGTVGLTLLTGHAAQGRAADYRNVLLGGVVAAATIASLVALAILASAPVLLPLFGPEFIAARAVLAAVMVASVIEAVGSVAYQHMTGRARMWQSLAFVTLPRDLVFLVAVLALVPVHLEWGVAYAAIASQITMLAGIVVAHAIERRRAT